MLLRYKFLPQKHWFFLLSLIPLGLGNHLVAKKAVHHRQFSTFLSWKRKCDSLPRFNKYIPSPCETPLSLATFTNEMDLFSKTMNREFVSMHWVDGITPKENYNAGFQAYVQKIVLPPQAKVAIHGDFHGDIHSLHHFIETFVEKGFLDKQNPFKICNENFYILFLGDYVDRGWYGAEVLYTILRLKNENPKRVFMVRGNHEEISLNAHYGFTQEIVSKFKAKTPLIKIQQVYNLLPVSLYLSVKGPKKENIIQCCHGGIELGFNPKILLEKPVNNAGQMITNLMREEGYKAIAHLNIPGFKQYFKNNTPVDTYNGFMWNDFIVDPNTKLNLSVRDGYSGTMFEFGKQPTEALLKAWSSPSYELKSIFRAHQHSCNSMKSRILNNDNLSHPDDAGLGKLWIEDSIHQSKPSLLNNVSAITFSVAPEAGYNWPIHAFALLHVASTFEDWRLEVIHGNR